MKILNKLFKKRKIRIGIEIDEILRSKCLQADRYYCQDFDESGIPEQPYVFDFFKEYKWEAKTEIIKELKEPEDCPEFINPIDYQPDDEGVVPADAFLFKKSEKINLTPKEVYNKFMYEDYLLEISGLAPLIYKGLDVHMNKFIQKYENYIDITILSIENKLSIPPTLYFLGRTNCSRFRNYKFVENSKEMWKDVDILITTNPEILNDKIPFGKKVIKVKRPYNVDIKNKCLEVLQLNDLNGNKEFEKLINYKETNNK
jgi:hypothetical protein